MSERPTSLKSRAGSLLSTIFDLHTNMQVDVRHKTKPVHQRDTDVLFSILEDSERRMAVLSGNRILAGYDIHYAIVCLRPALCTLSDNRLPITIPTVTVALTEIAPHDCHSGLILPTNFRGYSTFETMREDGYKTSQQGSLKFSERGISSNPAIHEGFARELLIGSEEEKPVDAIFANLSAFITGAKQGVITEYDRHINYPFRKTYPLLPVSL